jgi:hypothetical protein
MAKWHGVKKEKNQKVFMVDLGVFVNAETEEEAEKFVVDSLQKGSGFFGGYSISSEELKED